MYPYAVSTLYLPRADVSHTSILSSHCLVIVCITFLFLSQLSVVVIITSRIITDYDDSVCSVRTGNEDI